MTKVLVSAGSYLPPGFVSGLMNDGLSSFGVILLLYFLDHCECRLLVGCDGIYFEIVSNDRDIFSRGYSKRAGIDLGVSSSKISRGVSELIRFGYMKRSGKEAKLVLGNVFRNYIRRKQTL